MKELDILVMNVNMLHYQLAFSNFTKKSNKGIRYPLAECDYAATKPGHLKRHKENKHGGIEQTFKKCLIYILFIIKS